MGDRYPVITQAVPAGERRATAGSRGLHLSHSSVVRFIDEQRPSRPLGEIYAESAVLTSQ